MSDALRKVQAGQPLVIPASAYNAFIDAALDFRQRTAHIGQGAQPVFQQASIVLVRNDSGSDRSRFEVLGLDVPIIAPDVNEEAFKNRLALAGLLPAADTHEGRYAVLAEPIAAGKIGRAVVDGVTVVKITVEDEAQEPRFAEMADGDATGLAAQAWDRPRSSGGRVARAPSGRWCACWASLRPPSDCTSSRSR